VTPFTCAALVKLSVSAKSQKTFKLSICISQTHIEFLITCQLMFIWHFRWAFEMDDGGQYAVLYLHETIPVSQ
jgi:hypothetical protein